MKVDTTIGSLVKNSVDRLSSHFLKCKAKSTELQVSVNSVKKRILDGGGDRAKLRHISNNKLLTNERLKSLCDDGEYYETGLFVGYQQPYGDIPRGGCFSVFGKINKRLCLIYASDATVKAGTMYPIQLRKQLRLQEWARQLRFPVVYLVDSGGAFLPLQAEIFPDKDHGGRIFYNEAILQNEGIPIFTLVCGSCTAGAAYIPTMSSEAGMVNGTGHIFLGGPPLVKAATGEVLSADELGGAIIHSRISGCSDHIFTNEFDGLQKIRDMASTLPNQTINLTCWDDPVDPIYSVDDLDGLLINIPDAVDTSRNIMFQILARVLDKSCFHEFKSEYGSHLITGFGRVAGFTTGILAGCGSLSELDCVKGSHFVQLCGHRNLPIISFVHTDANAILDDSKGCLLKAKASFLRSIATRNSKLITVIVGDVASCDYFCYGGRCMDSDFILSWPNGRFLSNLFNLENDNMDSVLHSAGQMAVDNVIEPCQTRNELNRILTILHTQSNLTKSQLKSPIYRF